MIFFHKAREPRRIVLLKMKRLGCSSYRVRWFNSNKAVYDIFQFDQAHLQHIKLFVKEKNVMKFTLGSTWFQDKRLPV